MSIKETLRRYSVPYEKPSGDARFIALSLAEIQEELQTLSNSLSIPEIRVPDIDLSGITAAIQELKSGAPGPLPPQNLDLNPVRETYEQTAAMLKDLMGEVKTTNHRLSGVNRGMSLPSHIGIKDEFSGNKLRIDSDGMLQFRSVTTPVSEETRFDYDTRTDGNPVYVGKAPQATPMATSDWKINRFEYDSSSRVTRIQTLTGAWSVRATLPWS